MFYKIISLLIILILLIIVGTNAFAHSGRLDKNGGHKVTKSYVYAGRYIYVKNSVLHYEDGMIEFKKGDYHYHVHPRANGYQDGVYLPVKDRVEVFNGDIDQ